MNTSEIMSAMIFCDGGASKVEELSTDGGSTDAGKVLVVGDNGKIAASDLTVGEGEVAIDKGLVVNGAAADAKVVGDAIRSLNGSLVSRLDYLALEQGGINTTSGNNSSLTNYVRTVNGIVNPMHIGTRRNDVFVSGIFVYSLADDSFLEYVNPGQQKTGVDVTPEDGTYIRLTFKRLDNTDLSPQDIQPDMTATMLILAKIDTDNNTVALKAVKDVTSEFIDGGVISTGNSIGTVILTTPSPNSGCKYIIKKCQYNDRFVITGTGGNVGRLWCFTDSNYRIIKVAQSSASAEDLEVIAPKNGYFIANINKNYDYELSVYQRMSVGEMAIEHHEKIEEIDTSVSALIKDYVSITNPHYLFWRMGAFDSNGAQAFSNGMLSADRFFTVVKLKAGSTVSKKSSVTRTTNLAFGYKLSESDTTLGGFISDAGNSITIEQDCIAYIGIRYAKPVEALLNDSILDAFDFDLKVIDYKSRYARGDGSIDIFAPSTTTVYPLNYGWPCPEIYYEGQHTDDTGWTISTSDISAIYDAFDALVSASNGYLTKSRDYGVAYTGNAGNELYDASSEWHLYEYTTKPATAYNTVPKVAITCCMHGNEKMSAYAMHYLMHDLIYNGTKNPALAWIKSNLIITFLPICNPYGFMKATPSRLNENGVNLNRNFPTYNWGAWEDDRTDGNGSQPGGMNYKGEAAASETETKMMMQFYRNHYDAVLAIDLHTNGADTAMRDQISAYMPALAQSESDKDYDILASFITPGKNYTTRLKQWLNDKYNANMPYNYAYGTSIPIDYYPCAPHWVRETAGLVGQCYEVMAGSSTGVMGGELTVYAPATIKAAAEELGNILLAILNHCKNLK